MISIDYPAYSYQTKLKDGVNQIFDPFRKIWVVLTPEEWVRQNFLQYLHQSLNYPKSLIAVEKGLILGEMKKRFDILVYDKEQSPLILVECKRSNIKLTPDTIQQALNYNIVIPVKYIVITNGLETYLFEKNQSNVLEVTHLPLF